MIMGQNQGGIQRVVSKNVCYEKWSDRKLIEYEVKLRGESYLNTKWVREDEVEKRVVDQYEKSKEKNSRNGVVKLSPNSQQQDHQQSSTPRMIRQYNIGPFSSSPIRLSILINSNKIRKQLNHFIYNDRVQQILSQNHYVYQRSFVLDSNNNNNDGHRKNCYEEKMVKSIELNLGRGYEDNSNNKELYLKMTQLKQVQVVKSKKIMIRIWMKVRWQDGTVSQVKMDYLEQYQPQLMQKYKDSRSLYWRKWGAYNNNNNNNTNINHTEVITNSANWMDKNKKQQEQTNNQQTSESITQSDKPKRLQSFAQKQQSQTVNSVRKQLKLTPLEKKQSKDKEQNKTIMSYFSQIKAKAAQKQLQLPLPSSSQTAIKPIEKPLTKKKSINQMVVQQFRSKLLLKNYLSSSKPLTNSYKQQPIQILSDALAVGRKSVWADLSSVIHKEQMKQKQNSKEKQRLRQIISNGIKQQNHNKQLQKKSSQSDNKIVPIKKQIQLIVIDDD